MGSKAKLKDGLVSDRNGGAAQPRYEFYALADGMRLRLEIDPICDSDAEASLVALSIATLQIGIEVQRDGQLIYQAPPRGSSPTIEFAATRA